MATANDPNTFPDPTTVSPWPAAIRFGLIGGLVFVVYGLLGNITGFGRPSAGLIAVMVFALVSIVLYIGLLIFAIRKHRDEELGGYITFGRGLVVGVVVALIAGIVSSIFNYLYMTVIEPDMLVNLVTETREMMEDFGLPEEEIDKQISEMEEGMTPMKQLMQGMLFAGGIGTVASLIIAAVLKKDPPRK